MIGILFLLIYICLGVLFANIYLTDSRPFTRVWAGATTGVIFLMCSHVPFSLFMDFTILSHILGLLLTTLLVFAAWFFKNRQIIRSNNLESRRGISLLVGSWKNPIIKGELVCLAFVIPMTIYMGICLYNHTLNEVVDGAYYTGQCTYGDMNFHLGIITSIAEQGTFPPDYNIFPGVQLDYYFFCDSISSSLYIFGSSLRTAYIIPMLVASFLTFTGFWMLALQVLKRTSKAAIAWVLYFFNGGFGLIYFLDGLGGDDKSNFTRIFDEFYQTPTNYRDGAVSGTANIQWTNTVVDMMIPQRATLFGWMAVFLVIFLLYKAVFEDEKGLYLPAGILAGCLPMIQTYAYFTIGIAAICWIIFTLVRNKFSVKTIFSWLKFGLPALALSIPQLMIWIFGATDGEGFIRFAFNAYNETDNWLWFWVKNVGIVFVLLLPAIFSASKRLKLFYSAGIAIFLLTEFVVFQTLVYDNNKLYLMWYAFSVIIVANFMVDCFDKLHEMKVARVMLAVIVMVVATNAAFFTMCREIYSGTDEKAYCLYDAQQVKATEFILENTEPDSLFLSNYDHNNAISCLTGRNIFVGAGTFLYSHDVPYSDRQKIVKESFTDEVAFEENKELYGFDYVYISNSERYNFKGLILEYFQTNYTCVYNEDNILIFDVRS